MICTKRNTAKNTAISLTAKNFLHKKEMASIKRNGFLKKEWPKGIASTENNDFHQKLCFQ